MLPIKKLPPSRTSPKRMIMYSEPKMGKTTLLAALSNILILDLEDGAAFTDSMRIRIIGLRPPGENKFDAEIKVKRESVEAIKERQDKGEYYLIEAARELYKMKAAGDFPYQFLGVDTVTQLEDWCADEATREYMSTPVGVGFNRYNEKDQQKNPKHKKGAVKPYGEWQGALTLEYGAGYYYLRESFKFWVNLLSQQCDRLVLVGHLRDKTTLKEGTEVAARDIDLTGKIRNITCQQCDAITYLFRDKQKMFLSFESDEQLVSGTRPKHLRGKTIQIATSNEEGDLQEVNWGIVYPDLIEKS